MDTLLSIKEDSPDLTVKQVIAIAKTRLQNTNTKEIHLPESTVHRLLHRAGLMEKQSDGGTTKDRRQFSFKYAGELWMSDVMHGPALVREGRRKSKTYLIAFIDDATRVVPHAEFCWSENTAAFFPVFKKALLRRGLPLRMYVDNGAAYRSRQLDLLCAKLGVTVVHARPYQPQGKGKIERYFRTVRMQFLNQARVDTIEELNQRYWAWVEGEYHQNPHRGLGGETPLDRWAQVAGRITAVGPEMDLETLFLWESERKVRSDRTVSLNGHVYEVAAELVRQKVNLRYDPAAASTQPLQVWCNGIRCGDAKLVDQYANCFVKRDNAPESVNFTQLKDEEA